MENMNQLNALDKTLPFTEIYSKSELSEYILMSEIIKIKLDRLLKMFDKEEISEKPAT